MPQSNLFQIPQDGPYGDPCAGRHKGNAESKAAFERVEPHAGSLRDRVLAFVKARGNGGATVEEISDGMGLRYTTVSARVSELKALGLVRLSGLKRRTGTGSLAAVLVG